MKAGAVLLVIALCGLSGGSNVKRRRKSYSSPNSKGNHQLSSWSDSLSEESRFITLMGSLSSSGTMEQPTKRCGYKKGCGHTKRFGHKKRCGHKKRKTAHSRSTKSKESKNHRGKRAQLRDKLTQPLSPAPSTVVRFAYPLSKDAELIGSPELMVIYDALRKAPEEGISPIDVLYMKGILSGMTGRSVSVKLGNYLRTVSHLISGIETHYPDGAGPELFSVWEPETV